MQYMLLIYGDEAEWATRTEAVRSEITAEYEQFTDGIRRTGSFLAGARLEPTATATTVRIREGKRLVTDGPFAETREQLGGYYLVEARDLDDALALAARIPGARGGSIEVRPVRGPAARR